MGVDLEKLIAADGYVLRGRVRIVDKAHARAGAVGVFAGYHRTRAYGTCGFVHVGAEGGGAGRMVSVWHPDQLEVVE